MDTLCKIEDLSLQNVNDLIASLETSMMKIVSEEVTPLENSVHCMITNTEYGYTISSTKEYKKDDIVYKIGYLFELDFDYNLISSKVSFMDKGDILVEKTKRL